MKENQPDRSKPLLFSLIMAIVLIAAVELFSYVATTQIPFVRGNVYVAPQIGRQAFDTYLAERDPDLGWPSKTWLAKHADGNRARLSPANVALAQAPLCASAYGDSYAFGEDVADEFAWTNVLAKTLHCRINNYGVGGYGTDQAFLRMQRHVTEERQLGDTLILELMPDNVNRNVNQWRYLLTRSVFGFKPLFKKTKSGFEVAPLFDGSYDDFTSLASDPAFHLSAETFLPGAASFGATTNNGFPYSLTALRLFSRKFRSLQWSRLGSRKVFLNYPSHYDDSEGPSDRKVETLRHIIAEFGALCEATQKKCIFTLFPDPETLKQIDETGDHDFADLPGMIPDTIAYHDISHDLYEYSEGDFCKLYVEPEECSGHFNEKGNVFAAQSLARSMIINQNLAGNYSKDTE